MKPIFPRQFVAMKVNTNIQLTHPHETYLSSPILRHEGQH
jgi:hypothetical protein